MRASIAISPFVVATFEQTHTASAPSLPIIAEQTRYGSTNTTGLWRGRGVALLRPSCVAFEPLVNPYGLDPNGATSADTGVAELAALAGGVDRVATDA